MRKLLFLTLILVSSSISSYAQFSVHKIGIKTNDVVYDKNTDRVYVSIPSSQGSAGNSIGIINPNTYQLEKTVFIGSEPTVLAISDNGQYIYCGLGGASLIKRFNLSNQKVDQEITLTDDPFYGKPTAEDIEVMPGSPNIIAVTIKSSNTSPRHRGVFIYDNGKKRVKGTQGHTGSNRIEFKAKNVLVGCNLESSEYGMRTVSINDSGAKERTLDRDRSLGSYSDFVYFNNKVYSGFGKVFDITTTSTLIGSFQGVNGSVMYDTYNNLVCFADGGTWGDNLIFKRFDPNTFLLVDSISIGKDPNRYHPTVDAYDIVGCSAGIYAFNTTDSFVIVNTKTTNRVETTDSTLGKVVYYIDQNTTTTSSIAYQAEKTLSIYPNPTTDFITINTPKKISDIQMFDHAGRQVFVDNIDWLENRIDMTSTAKGTYILNISYDDGTRSSHRIEKK